MATKAQIIKRALIRAGVIGYDATPTDDQKNQVEVTLDAWHSTGVDRQIVDWELSDIPQEVEHALVSILAFKIANDFGVSAELYQRLALEQKGALGDIYAYKAEVHVDEPVKYY